MLINRNTTLMFGLGTIVAFAPAVAFSAEIVATTEGSQVFDAHVSTFSYFFNDSDMDFHFGNLILGSTVNHGVEIGEA